jgi:hypothetical protein
MTRLCIALLIVCSACNNQPTANNETTRGSNTGTIAKTGFFPVASYLKGQVYDIKQKGLTPIRYITKNNRTDSAMVSLQQIEKLAAPFLIPEIDSINMQQYYTESKFLDQTIDAFTFLYDAAPALPDSISLRSWSVYVEPETGKVRRVYMVKKEGNKTMQLTWLNNKWFKNTVLVTDANNNTTIESEEKISWDY